MKTESVYHLEQLLTGPESLSRVIEQAVRRLTPHRHSFSVIACQGVSGMLVAPAISIQLTKHLIVVRKTLDNCHSSRKIEGVIETCRYIIVDDLISSGDTMKKIQRGIYHSNPASECVGCYLFNTTEWLSADELRDRGGLMVRPLKPLEPVFPQPSISAVCGESRPRSGGGSVFSNKLRVKTTPLMFKHLP